MAGEPINALLTKKRRRARALPVSFYDRPVLDVASDLIGCVVRHGATSGVIVETEAYHDSEPACHAYIGLTGRTKTLFGPPGIAYVYRSYGIHALLNAVCECEGVGAAVLIRALMPLSGIESMRRRRGQDAELELCSGPGKLSQALDVRLTHNGTDLRRGAVQILGPNGSWPRPQLVRSERVGITKATDLSWRFSVADCRYVSRPRPAAQTPV